MKTLRQPKLQAPVGEKDAHAKGWRRRDTQDRTGAGAPKRKMGSEKMSENPADECSGAASERSMEKAQENCKHAQACLKALDRGSTEFDTKMCELRTCGGSFSAEPKSICANTCSLKNCKRVRSRGSHQTEFARRTGDCAQRKTTRAKFESKSSELT